MKILVEIQQLVNQQLVNKIQTQRRLTFPEYTIAQDADLIPGQSSAINPMLRRKMFNTYNLGKK